LAIELTASEPHACAQQIDLDNAGDDSTGDPNAAASIRLRAENGMFFNKYAGPSMEIKSTFFFSALTATTK
jgi:hypothetical protein